MVKVSVLLVFFLSILVMGKASDDCSAPFVKILMLAFGPCPYIGSSCMVMGNDTWTVSIEFVSRAVAENVINEVYFLNANNNNTELMNYTETEPFILPQDFACVLKYPKCPIVIGKFYTASIQLAPYNLPNVAVVGFKWIMRNEKGETVHCNYIHLVRP